MPNKGKLQAQDYVNYEPRGSRARKSFLHAKYFHNTLFKISKCNKNKGKYKVNKKFHTLPMLDTFENLKGSKRE